MPWHVTLVNGGHECVVVEAGSPADPLSPPPADPDVLDPPDYRQIAQRNLSVLTVSGMIRSEFIITVSAGARADKAAVIEVVEGDALPAELLGSLGLKTRRYAGAERISAGLSERSLCGQERAEGDRALRLAVPRGTSAAAYLSVAAREPLAPEEYAVIRVVERDQERVTGGASGGHRASRQPKGRCVMTATPMAVETRPFAVEPLTNVMLPDGILDNALYNLRISCHYTNTSGTDLNNVKLYLESTGDPGIAVTAADVHVRHGSGRRVASAHLVGELPVRLARKAADQLRRASRRLYVGALDPADLRDPDAV